MRGYILGFDKNSGAGAVTGPEGRRYEFAGTEWRSDTPPEVADEVDFMAEGDQAKALYLIEPPPEPFNWGRFLFWSSGRISRSHYWLRWIVPYFALYAIIWGIDIALGLGGSDDFAYSPGPLTEIFSLAAVWSSVVMSLKRIHDHNRSGWFYLVLLIPVVQLWPLVEILFLRGTVGRNRFGPDPVRSGKTNWG